MHILQWRCCLRPGAEQQFDYFANTELLHVYRQQPGCLGVSLLCRDSEVMLLSYWQDRADPVRMQQSACYLALLDWMWQQEWLLSTVPAQSLLLSGGFLSARAATDWQSAHLCERDFEC